MRLSLESGESIREMCLLISQKIEVQFPAPTLGSSQLSVTPAQGDLRPSSSLPEHAHVCVCVCMCPRMHTHTIFFKKKNFPPQILSLSSLTRPLKLTWAPLVTADDNPEYPGMSFLQGHATTCHSGPSVSFSF